MSCSRSGVASLTRTPRMPRPRGSSPIARVRLLVDAGGDEAFELRTRRVDDAERGVARAGQLRRGLDELLQQRVERELRAERDPRLDERAQAFARGLGFHAAIIPANYASSRLSTNGRMPPCRRYSRSRGVSRRRRARELLLVGAHRHLAGVAVVDTGDRELLAAGEAERPGRLAVPELERQDAHHQQVRAVDALVRLRDHGLHAEQLRALRRPVARRAGAVLLARDHDQRRPLGEITLRRVEDRHLLAARHVHRPRPLGSLDEQVAQPHVRERAAHHHLVIAAARAVRVEVLALDAVLDEVLARRRVRADRARGRHVVGRHRVAEQDEAARAVDVLDRLRLARHVVEVRRPAHVRRAPDPTRTARPRARAASATSRRR